MKRHNHLYQEICSFENLLDAAKKARRGKRFQDAVALFHHNIEEELVQLKRELLSETYRPGKYRNFTIYDTKPRLISAAPYRDRIVHHALCNILEPLFEPTFIYHSYACRKGKGTHKAVDFLQKKMQSHAYYLQCDIQRYFPSINHQVLEGLLDKKIKCKPTMRLIHTLLENAPVESLSIPEAQNRTGLPIGNQTSQFFANVYLNPLDHRIIEDFGACVYLRYVDDFIILDDSKLFLNEIRAKISEFLGKHLLLKLHPKRQTIAPVTRSADFLGFHVFPSHRRLRRENGYRFVKRLRKMQDNYRKDKIDLRKVNERVSAWLSHSSHADTFGLRTAIFESAVFSKA